jgi:Family of unknown function (DUF6585)
MARECPKCSYMVPANAEGREAPWCPKCGSDLKAAVRPVAATVPASSLVAAAVGSNGSTATARPATLAHEQVEPPDLVAPADVSTGASSPPDLASLGEPEQVFKSKILYQALAWLCVVVCFGIAAIALWQFVQPPRIPTRPAVLYGTAAFFAFGGLVAAFVGIKLRGQQYLVFPGHLVEIQSGRCTILRWDQIRAVYLALHPAWKKYEVVTSVGKPLTLTGETSRHTMLGELIAERVAERLFPDAWQRVEQGGTVSFGPLAISRAGVDCNGEHVPWHQIGKFSTGLDRRPIQGTTSMQSNMIHFWVTPSCRVEMGEIANFRLFEQIARLLHPTCLS